MRTIDEIRGMSPEQVEAETRKLGRQLILKRVVIPVALVVATELIFRKLDSRNYSNH